MLVPCYLACDKCYEGFASDEWKNGNALNEIVFVWFSVHLRLTHTLIHTHAHVCTCTHQSCQFCVPCVRSPRPIPHTRQAAGRQDSSARPNGAPGICREPERLERDGGTADSTKRVENVNACGCEFVRENAIECARVRLFVL
jgi:hypothetical protein